MDDTKFYFGSLEFKQVAILHDFEDFQAANRAELIKERLFEFVNESDIIFRESDGYWRFGKCEKWEGHIIGKLGKIFTEERTTWDEDLEDYKTIETEIEVADVSFFIIDPVTEGIAFNRKLHTGSTKFANAFAKGYNKYYNLDDEIEIELVRTGGDKHYKEILREARRIFSVDFDLEPVNPSADEEMEILDSHIKGMNADEMGLEAESGEGLNPDDEFIRSGFALSDDGDYGDYTVRFEKDGETVTYDSRGDYEREESQDPDDLDDLKTQAKALLTKLDELLTNWRSSEDDEDS